MSGECKSVTNKVYEDLTPAIQAGKVYVLQVGKAKFAIASPPQGGLQ
jgi:hypothetical protein